MTFGSSSHNYLSGSLGILDTKIKIGPGIQNKKYSILSER